MRSTNRKRSLIVSGAMILLCFTMLTGVTLALFTDRQSVTQHLEAGTLELTMYRTSYTKTMVNADGFLEDVTVVDQPRVNFSNPSDDEKKAHPNIFEIASNEKIVPGSSYSATLLLENRSDVACGYWIEITPNDDKKAAFLAEQLQITVKVQNGVEEKSFVSKGLTVGGEAREELLGVIAKYHDDNQTTPYTATFTVTVEFLDSFIAANNMEKYANDNAQGQDLSFDLIVHAVQVTSATP